MSKTKLLFDLVGDLRALAKSIQAIADAIADSKPVEAKSPGKPVSTKASEPTAKVVTLEQVRAVLADKSQQGFTAGVRMLLEKHGASKLSQIDPANYAALMTDAENLK